MFIFIIIFFFNDTATTEIYTLSLHDALPICKRRRFESNGPSPEHEGNGDVHWVTREPVWPGEDRKSTRLNSSHLVISYAVFCLKKNKKFVGKLRTAALKTCTVVFEIPRFTEI